MSTITVELGNADPIRPQTAVIGPDGKWVSVEADHDGLPVTTAITLPCDPDNFPEGHHAYALAGNSGEMTGAQIKQHIADALVDNRGITHLPGYEAVISIVHPDGSWQRHAKQGTKPTFVATSCDDAALLPAAQEYGRLISEFYGCPLGAPADYEQTHWTSHGGMSYAPGDAPTEGVPTSIPDVQANITQNGRDMQASVFGTRTGVSGTGTTAPGATSITLDDQGAPGSTSKWNGQVIICGGVWALVESNTNAAPPVLTIDRWYSFATPGGAAASTPAAGKYEILQVTAAVQFMGLSTSTTALANPSTNTSLPSEITTVGGGLIRQICPIAHTASTNVTTLTPVFTANGSDSLPVTIGSIGTFNSMVVANATFTMFFNTLLSTTATLSSSGDQLTVTQTITGT